VDEAQTSGPIDVARMKEIAAQAVDPCVTSSMVVSAFWQEARVSEIDPKAGYDAIRDEADAVRDGVMTSAQATLVGHSRPCACAVLYVNLATKFRKIIIGIFLATLIGIPLLKTTHLNGQPPALKLDNWSLARRGQP